MLGKVIGQQRILQRNPTPGVTVRYICEDTRTGKERWIWRVPEALCTGTTGKKSERASALLKLSHDNAARYRAAGRVPELGFITVTEPLDGAPLRDQLGRISRIDAKQALWLGLQIIQGLAAAHEVGVYHGAVTPEVVWTNESGQVQLAGFELAEAIGGPHRGTHLARIMDTPQMLAPEQLVDTQDITRADIYQVAATVYMAWTGHAHLPPLGSDLKFGLEALIRHHNRNARELGPRPSERLDDLRRSAPRLDSLISSMLSSDPARRPIAMEIVKAMWWQCGGAPAPEPTQMPTAEAAGAAPLGELPPPVS
ncbi:MAG: protein kinase [Myxococcota bacterium]